MKILVAPNSFKESLSAVRFCEVAAKAIRRVDKRIKVEQVPIADGGDGTLEALLFANNGIRVPVAFKGPLGRVRRAYLGYIKKKKLAIIEMAHFSGLNLIKSNKRNPLKTTSFGTGQAIKKAIKLGAKKIVLGIGGSATIDCGAGMLQALGMKGFDESGKEINGLLAGGDLRKLKRIDVSVPQRTLAKIDIEIACDVDNRLFGKNGAVNVYGPQKGARKKDFVVLESGLKNFVNLFQQCTGKNNALQKGAGAAGGIAVPLITLAKAKLVSGIEMVLDANDFDRRLSTVDLVITGEGRIDKQTLMGKAPMGVLKRAHKYKIPVIAIAGSAGDIVENPFDGIFSIIDAPMDLQAAMKNTDVLLEKTVVNIIKLLVRYIG